MPFGQATSVQYFRTVTILYVHLLLRKKMIHFRKPYFLGPTLKFFGTSEFFMFNGILNDFQGLPINLKNCLQTRPLQY